MKAILRSILVNIVALWVTSYLISGIHLGGGFATLIMAGVVFALINLLVKPIISLLFLPVNLISLGLLSWVVNVIMLFVFIKVFPAFSITEWRFEGFDYQGFIIPAMTVSVLWTAILASFIISTISSFFNWLTK